MVPINGSGLTRVALLNDFSCFGKCSLTVSIPIISSYGIETVPLPTAVLSTHTGGFDRFVMRDMTDDMRQIAAHWKEMDMQFDCIYTGFFCTIEQIAFAREFIRTFSGPRTLLLSDPVLGDNGSLYSCFSEEFAAEMRKLCEMADIITPNRTEARLLLGGAADDESVSNEALLEGLRNENVIITSVRRGDKIGYLARLGDEIVRIEKPWYIVSCMEQAMCSPQRSAGRYSVAIPSKKRCLPRRNFATAVFKTPPNINRRTGTDSALRRN